MFTNAARTTMLNSLTLAFLSAHTAYPGHTGANEITGGFYARAAATIAAATGTPPSRSQSGTVDITIPAGNTVRWVGAADLVSSGNIYGVMPNGGAPKEFEVDVSNNLINLPAHGYVSTSGGTKVTFYGGTPPGGLTEGNIYFVIASGLATDQFRVSATSGGSAITLTDVGFSACLVSKIIEETFSGDGTTSVTSAVFTLNN